MSNPAITVESIPVGQVTLRVALAGPADGPLVVLLHGFPECKETWSGIQTRLAAAGYRVAAPDMRGYAGSDRPAGVSEYTVTKLVGDVAGLISALTLPGQPCRAHVVGHDWGGVVAWWTAMLEPGVVDRLGIVNAPHPVGFVTALQQTALQRRHSWYVGFFQIPVLPELVLPLVDFALVRSAFFPGHVTRADVDLCVDALRPRGAVEAAIAYYRAEYQDARNKRAPKPAVIQSPVMVLWGMQDRFLIESLRQPPVEWVPSVEVVPLPDTSHWAPVEAPDAIATNLDRHFKA